MRQVGYVTSTPNGTWYVRFFDKDGTPQTEDAPGQYKYELLETIPCESWEQGAAIVEARTGRRPQRRGARLASRIARQLRKRKRVTRKTTQLEPWAKKDDKAEIKSVGKCESHGIAACCDGTFPVELMECHHIIRELHGSVANGACLCPNGHALADAEQQRGGGPITNHLIAMHQLSAAVKQPYREEA